MNIYDETGLKIAYPWASDTVYGVSPCSEYPISGKRKTPQWVSGILKRD